MGYEIPIVAKKCSNFLACLNIQWENGAREKKYTQKCTLLPGGGSLDLKVYLPAGFIFETVVPKNHEPTVLLLTCIHLFLALSLILAEEVSMSR